MKCLITGVAGFIGSSLAERLLSDGVTVVGVDCFVPYYPKAIKERNLSSLISHKNFSFKEVALQDAPLNELLKDVEVVYHQAAQAGVRASWGKEFTAYTDHNISSTQMLLEACKGSKSIKKIVYASSSSVYGNAESYPTLESFRPSPISPYGVSKLAGEHLMELYRSQFNVPTTSLRYFTVFGPRQRPDMAFHKFIRAAVHGEEIPLYGDGTQIRDFTYISDIIDANILASEKGVGVYNIGGGTHVSVNDVLSFLETRFGAMKINRGAAQVGDVKITSADTTRAQKDLGFKPKVSLHDGLDSEIEFLKALFKEGL